MAYEQGGDIWAAVLNDSLAVTRGPINVSTGIATENRAVEVASDYHDFVAAWHGQNSGDKVFQAFIDSTDSSNPPPTAPGLLTPADGMTFPPTRAYLSWNASTDPDGGAVTYNVYFGESVLPATPQVTGVTETDFVIGPEAQATTGITLQSSRTYQWKVEAIDNEGQGTSSVVRTLNTDNSVVAWYRFNEDPMGSDCLGGAGGETVCDYSGRNNHGIPIGGVSFLSPGMDILDGALFFDGVDDRVKITNDVSLNISNSLTLSCKFTASPWYGPDFHNGILMKHGLESGPYGLAQVVSDNLRFALRFSDGWAYVDGSLIDFFGKGLRTTGTWDSSSMSLFFDKDLKSSIPASGAISNNSNVVYIGYHPDYLNSYYNGIMEDCLIYTRAISIDELIDLVDSN